LLVKTVIEELDEAECWRLIDGAEVGRIGFTGRYGQVVLPVNYKVHDGSLVFRTGEHSPLEEDLHTGIADADYKVAFEIDDIDTAERAGWSVLVQGAAHLVHDEAEQAKFRSTGVDPWAGGVREMFVRISPTRISGRRITHPR
jgi:nitroimidazol reductase NimA-like FMN-containing flavoprotein (pyridoxamine 5'-phosphate oxidase superfamily)